MEKIEFEPSDIKWIKSVTRDKGTKWAYLDVKIGDTFPLHFSKNPKWYPTNYLKPKKKEVIALFQTIKNIEDYQNGWHVTHLISPIEDYIEKENDGKHPYTRLMTVIAINSNPILVDSDIWSFYKCNRGQICDIRTVEQRSKPDLTNQVKQNFIWSLFKNINPDLYNNISSIIEGDSDIEEISVTEGRARTILRLHKYKERNPKIIAAAKECAKRENRFHCEICLFNFEIQYPVLGNDFIECHHINPISKGGVRETKVEDLAIVCANCHRMLHKKSKKGNYFSILELKKLINKKMN